MNLGENKQTIFQAALPGFTRKPKTEIRYINNNYCGFEFYEFEHEILFQENGLAFGFIGEQPETMKFYNYLKNFTIKCYLNREGNFAFLSAPSDIVYDLLKNIKKNPDLDTEIEEYTLDMQNLRSHVDDYLGAWFRKVSTRVTSSALFGSDLMNEPIYQQLIDDGAILTSVFIPYNGMRIQINDKAGISSKQNFESIPDELSLVQSLKSEIIDRIII
jgi:hypothetical protein